MAIYNPLAMFSPTNARFDLASQILGETMDRGRARDSLASQQKNAQRYLGLQQMAQYQPDELKNPEFMGQMNQAQMGMFADPQQFLEFGLRQQRANEMAKQEQALADPRVQELMMIQKNAELKGQRLIGDYLRTNDPKEEERIQSEYFGLAEASNLAGAELGANPHTKGYLLTPMRNFYDLVNKANIGMSSKELKDLEIEKKGYEVSKARADVGNIATDTAIKSEQLKKVKTQAGYDAEDRIKTALATRGLSYPDVYDTTLSLARTAKDKESIFMMVKLISQAIEPGLSVTEGEANSYMIGGQGAIARMLMNSVGASTKDSKKLLTLLEDVIKEKRKASVEVIKNKGVMPLDGAGDTTKRTKLKRNW